MCCLINSSHTQVDSQSLSFLQKEGCILPHILMHAKQFGSNIISRRRYGTEMKNKLAEEGWTTCLSWVIPIFLNLCKSWHKVLPKSWFRIQCVTNTTVTMLTICNSELGLRGPEKQAAFKDRGQMHDAVLLHTGLHYWTRTIVNYHPQKSIALWGSILKGTSGVPLITIQASCNSWKHSGKANSTKSKRNFI